MAGVKIEPFNVQLGGAAALLNAYATGEICPQTTDPTTDQVYLYSDNFASTPVPGPIWDVDFGIAGAPQPTPSASFNVLTVSITPGGLNVLNRDYFLAYINTYPGFDTTNCGVFVEVVHEGQTGPAAYRGGVAIGLNNNQKQYLMFDYRNGALINGDTVLVIVGMPLPAVGDVCRLNLRHTTFGIIAECLINNVVVGSNNTTSINPGSNSKRVGLSFRGLNTIPAGTISQSWSNFKAGVI